MAPTSSPSAEQVRPPPIFFPPYFPPLTHRTGQKALLQSPIRALRLLDSRPQFSQLPLRSGYIMVFPFAAALVAAAAVAAREIHVAVDDKATVDGVPCESHRQSGGMGLPRPPPLRDTHPQ